MVRSFPQPSLLLAACFLIAPAAATAQQSGTLMLENRTGNEIRIGCDHYVDAQGQEVKVGWYWTLPPGFNGKLQIKGSDVVAQKFVFFLITPEGESAGWYFDKISEQGNLHQNLDAGNYAHHKTIATKAKSVYPALQATVVAAELTIPVQPLQLQPEEQQLKDAIQRDEDQLDKINNKGLPFAKGAVTTARLIRAFATTQKDADDADKLLALANLALEAVNIEKDRVETNINTNQRRLRQLQASK
jgi:hypothetical protein